MNSEKVVPAICIIGLGGAGVIAWFDGQQGVSYAFLAFAACFLLGISYEVYRRRSMPAGGPPDPSAQWSRNSGAAHNARTAVFAYSRTTLVVLRWLAPLPALVGPAIYFLSSPRPIGGDLIGLGVFEILFVLAFYAAYRACAAYSIEVRPDSIRVDGFFRANEIPFSSLGKVALLENGGRGPRYVLALYDKQEKQMCLLSNGVEGFEEMVALIKERAFAAGTPYRYRDMWGCWTT